MLLAACGGEDAPSSQGGDGGSGAAPGSGGDSSDCVVPADVAALEAFLDDGGYQSWSAEPGPHDSTGPHFGAVRVFVNDVLFDSLDAGQGAHPRCAATVKELYGGGTDVLGYSVWLKIDDESAGGANLFWYEKYQGSTYADGLGAGICTGCHGGGLDYFLTPFPL